MWHQYCNTCEEKLHTKKEEEQEQREIGWFVVNAFAIVVWLENACRKEINGKQMRKTNQTDPIREYGHRFKRIKQNRYISL